MRPTSNTLDEARIKITMLSETPDFEGNPPEGKEGDVITVGQAPGRIQVSDPRVYNKPISDLDSTGPVVFAVVQDANNSIVASYDRGFSWEYLSSAFPTADPKYSFKYMSTLGSTLYLWRDYMDAAHPPVVSNDNGRSWGDMPWIESQTYNKATTKWLPARRNRNGGMAVYLVNISASNEAAKVYSYNPDEGFEAKPETVTVTYNTVPVSAASYGTRMLMISAAGEVVRRHDNLDSTRWSKGGTLPQAGVLWADIVSINKNTFVACAASGTATPTLAYTTNFGQTWTLMTIPATSGTSPILKGIHCNTDEELLVVLGEKTAFVGQCSDFPTVHWLQSPTYDQVATQSVTSISDGFVAASSTISIYTFQVNRDSHEIPDWKSSVGGNIKELYFKRDTKWVPYSPDLKSEDYLLKSGGTITGIIDIGGGGGISGLPDPTDDSHPVPYGMVKKISRSLPRKGSIKKQTVFDKAIEFGQYVEVLKVTIAARTSPTGDFFDGTSPAGRYYSEIVIVTDTADLVNGKVQPKLTEYAVISTGGLQLDVKIDPVTQFTQDVNVTFTANKQCNLDFYVSTLDIGGDSYLSIKNEVKYIPDDDAE